MMVTWKFRTTNQSSDYKVDMEIYINKSADSNDSDIEIHDKYVTSNDSEIKQNEESCSDDSNDGNDDDIEYKTTRLLTVMMVTWKFRTTNLLTVINGDPGPG
ncbi:uncharacterized protein LOC132758647 [Ruditapes philippinarum]|uniref:uncharacterized protein LOC132758647 n=1 Tax=Ruditapes philippinarum TaxID=129788 RepID=UPI00295BADEB|nr:uncharacterized protein LOC132758647 [Ruditapes philippinarum]